MREEFRLGKAPLWLAWSLVQCKGQGFYHQLFPLILGLWKTFVEDGKDEMEGETEAFSAQGEIYLMSCLNPVICALFIIPSSPPGFFLRMNPWICCRIPLKDEMNSVLEAFGDSDFKESLKWRPQVLELWTILGWKGPTRISRSDKSHLFFKVCKIRLVDFEDKVGVFLKLIFFCSIWHYKDSSCPFATMFELLDLNKKLKSNCSGETNRKFFSSSKLMDFIWFLASIASRFVPLN